MIPFFDLKMQYESIQEEMLKELEALRGELKVTD
jgi:hypothetical protein